MTIIRAIRMMLFIFSLSTGYAKIKEPPCRWEALVCFLTYLGLLASPNDNCPVYYDEDNNVQKEAVQVRIHQCTKIPVELYLVDDYILKCSTKSIGWDKVGTN
jgi:hypothetical protein